MTTYLLIKETASSVRYVTRITYISPQPLRVGFSQIGARQCAGTRRSSARMYNAKISTYKRKRRLVKQYLRSHIVRERALATFNLSVALKHPHYHNCG